MSNKLVLRWSADFLKHGQKIFLYRVAVYDDLLFGEDLGVIYSSDLTIKHEGYILLDSGY